MSYRYKTVKRSGKTVLLHRWLVEQRIGRPLLPGEQVHHRDGNPHNNADENLELTTAKKHMHLHKQKHPEQSKCVICRKVFTPHPTKRARQQTCGWGPCRNALIAVKRHGVPMEVARARI